MSIRDTAQHLPSLFRKHSDLAGVLPNLCRELPALRRVFPAKFQKIPDLAPSSRSVPNAPGSVVFCNSRYPQSGDFV